MTRQQILELSGRELDLQIGSRVMGYKVKKSAFYPTEKKRLQRNLKLYKLVSANGDWLGPNWGGVHGWGWVESPERAWECSCPDYSTSLDACREAEEALLNSGHRSDYWRALCEMLTAKHGELDDSMHFVMADATTRCRALLLAARAA